jgi:hypothetical protein
VTVSSRLVLDGDITTVNVSDIWRKVTDRVAALTEMNRETRTLWHGVETVVDQFCVGLAHQPDHLHHIICE